jgi:hypothetical protein
MSEAARKSWQTRRRKKTGKRVAEHRRQLMVKVKGMLKEWGENVEDIEICAVCGDGLPKSILQIHHLNPFDKSEGEIRLCASCHNIFNKAKETTKLTEIVQDLEHRHKRFECVRKMSLEHLC